MSLSETRQRGQRSKRAALVEIREHLVDGSLNLALLIVVALSLGLFLVLFWQSVRFFLDVPVTEFLFGLNWSPQLGLREDQVGSSGAFGIIPLVAGTGLIAAIALMLAVPMSLFSAIYVSEFATERAKRQISRMIGLLACVPSVVFGVIAMMLVGPMVRDAAELMGFGAGAETALAVGLVLGVMISPFLTALFISALSDVPTGLRQASQGLGATQSETIFRLVIPAAMPRLKGALILALAKLVSETIVVVMAAGLVANLSFLPLESVTTITVQIVALLGGYQDMDSPRTLAAFALGLFLLLLTIGLNLAAFRLINNEGERR